MSVFSVGIDIKFPWKLAENRQFCYRNDMDCRCSFDRDYLAEAGWSRADLLTRQEALALRKGLTGWLVYVLWSSTPQRLFPIYVGIGTKRRPFDHSCPSEQIGNGIKRGLLRRCAAEGGTILFSIVTTSPDRQVVQDEERRLVALFGRRMLGTGPLANLTEGGEGVSGAVRKRGAAHGRARRVFVEGQPFEAIVEAASALRLTDAVIHYRIRAGWPGYRYADEPPRLNRKGRKSGSANVNSKSVIAGGVRYDTLTAAAAALGFRPPVIIRRIAAGWPGYFYEKEGQRVQAKPHRTYPVSIYGVTYANMIAASKSTGIDHRTIRWRIIHRKPGYLCDNPAYAVSVAQ